MSFLEIQLASIHNIHGSDTRYPIFTRSQHSLFFSLPFKGGIHLIKEDLEISLLKEYLP